MAIPYRKSVEMVHFINFDAIGNVDIRLHCLVITMPRPFNRSVCHTLL